jgi:hypothetical protein
MATLELRIAALEAASTRRHRDDPRQVAMEKVFHVLWEAPEMADDPYTLSPRGALLPPGHQWRTDKIRAMSCRLETGRDTEEDRMLLVRFPPDALEVSEMTAAEFVSMVAGIELLY